MWSLIKESIDLNPKADCFSYIKKVTSSEYKDGKLFIDQMIIVLSPAVLKQVPHWQIFVDLIVLISLKINALRFSSLNQFSAKTLLAFVTNCRH